MPQISVRYDDKGVKVGLKKVSDGLPRLPTDVMDDIFEKARYEVSGGWQGGASYDVPEVYGQTYQRTGNLGASTNWTREGYSYKMVSNAVSPKGEPYSRSVLGDASGAGQAKAFIGRWPNFAQVMRKWADYSIRRMKDAADALVNHAFGL